MNHKGPYLSVVVASRNDDHGGSLLRRTQTFVNAFLDQAKRHFLSTELIFVEWNPPKDRTSLHNTLKWPTDLGPCRVRFIAVPPELHHNYKNAKALPLYQMIAKNAGIRRACGRFILATNIDILFSEELMAFLASRRLEPGKMYRLDRLDVMSDVPVDGSIEERLAYCETHLLRINAREGTFPLTGDGRRVAVVSPTMQGVEPITVLQPTVGRGAASGTPSAGADICFGHGWFPVEQHAGEVFRWAGAAAEVQVRCPSTELRNLALEVEPGPSAALTPLTLQAWQTPGVFIGEVTLSGRSLIEVTLPFSCGEQQTLQLRTVGGGRPLHNDRRVLNFRVFHCEWVKTPVRSEERKVVIRAISLKERIARFVHRWRRGWQWWRSQSRVVRIGLPLPSALTQKLKLDGSGLSIEIGPRGNRLFRRAVRQTSAAHETGICWGAGWHVEDTSTRDSIRWATGDAEVILHPPHARPMHLAIHLEPGPGAGNGPARFEIRDQDGNTKISALVRRRRWVQLTMPLQPGRTEVFSFHITGSKLAAPQHVDDPPIPCLRVLDCHWVWPDKQPAAPTPALVPAREADVAPAGQGITWGAGWGPIERDATGNSFRSGTSGTEVILRSVHSEARRVRLDLEPASGNGPVEFEVHDAHQQTMAQGVLRGRQILHLTLPLRRNRTHVFSLHVSGVSSDTGRSAHKAFRLFRLEWSEDLADALEHSAGLTAGLGWSGLRHKEDGRLFRSIGPEADLTVDVPTCPSRVLLLETEPVIQTAALHVRDSAGEVLAASDVSARQIIRVPLSWQPGERRTLRLSHTAPELHILYCGWERAKHWNCLIEDVRPGALPNIVTDQKRFAVAEGWRAANCESSDPAILHTNACGDFTLMAREHWFDVRAYAEFDLYSFNIDSLLCYSAHYAGARQHMLQDPMRIYHIEHGRGSGWTPEGQAELFERLAAKGIGHLDWSEVLNWAAQMRQFNCPLIFNPETWGLADANLEETSVPGTELEAAEAARLGS